jgi:uncharacterized protein YcfJ
MAELDLLNYPGSKLGGITSPAPSLLKPSTKQTALGPQDKGQEYLAQIEPEMEELKKSTLAKSEIDTAQKQQLAESTARQKQAMSEASAAERQTIESSAPYQEEKTVQEQLKNAAFVPRQDNAQDLATLFSLINVLGFAIGSGGKGNAQQALAAMDGMAKGYQQGRVDLYKREKDLFDTSMKTLKTKSDVLSKQVQEIVSLAARDKQAATEMADSVFAQEGADFYREYAKRFGLAALAEYDKQRVAGVTKAFDLKTAQENTQRQYEQKEREMQARERQHRENMAAAERREAARMTHQEKMAQLKGVGKAASATNERYANTVFRASNEVLRNLELVEKIGITTGGGALGGVVGKGTISSEVQRNLGQYFTEEQQRNYNTAMSGIALELAYVLNGGYKPNEGQISKLDALLSVGPNDTYGNAAYKFSDVTAKLKAAIETSPAYTEDQKKTKEMLVEKMDKYATPEQVQDRVYGTPRSEEPVVRAGEVSRPQSQADFDAIPENGLYVDPDDGKTYRKKRKQ